MQRRYVQKSPHLLEYLHTYPVNTYGMPLFFSELKRDLKGIKDPNLIYPASEETFIHIFPDPMDARNYYIPIEPSFLHSVNDLIPAVELQSRQPPRCPRAVTPRPMPNGLRS